MIVSVDAVEASGEKWSLSPSPEGGLVAPGVNIYPFPDDPTLAMYNPYEWPATNADPYCGGPLMIDPPPADYGHFGYSVLIRLDAQETTDYCVDGRAFLGRLAQAIQDTRTGQRGSTSPYQARDVAPLYSDKIASAVEAWQAGDPPKDPSV